MDGAGCAAYAAELHPTSALRTSLINTPFRIAAMAGDGIGQEVMPEGLRVLEAAAQRHDIALRINHFEWAGCHWFRRHGTMMPDDWQRQLASMDAIYFGAIGWPGVVSDAVATRGSLLKIGRAFDQCISLRPVRLFDGVPSPLAGRRTGDIDFHVVRDNSHAEGFDERRIARPGSALAPDAADRVLAHAFELARSRDRHHLTIATRSMHSADDPIHWEQRATAVARRYPDVIVDLQPIDQLCAHFVSQPTHFDVVVASSLFGDILSDLGPACTGTIGLAPSAALNPERRHPSLFRPLHGSAPDIHGRAMANPIAMIWSGALMLDFLGHGMARFRAAHDAILRAIEAVLVEGPHTPDLGGGASTADVGMAIAERVRRG